MIPFILVKIINILQILQVVCKILATTVVATLSGATYKNSFVPTTSIDLVRGWKYIFLLESLVSVEMVAWCNCCRFISCTFMMWFCPFSTSHRYSFEIWRLEGVLRERACFYALNVLCVSLLLTSCLSVFITFMHLETLTWLTITFRLYIFNQYVCSLGIEPTTFCAADAMLYHWATGTSYHINAKRNVYFGRKLRIHVMRRVWCPASRFIAPISSLSRALAPHVQWADWHDREGNKVSAFKFSLFYEEFQTLKTGFELFCGVTDHAHSRFASVQAKLGAYYRKFLILGLNLRYDVLNLDFLQLLTVISCFAAVWNYL